MTSMFDWGTVKYGIITGKGQIPDISSYGLYPSFAFLARMEFTIQGNSSPQFA